MNKLLANKKTDSPTEILDQSFMRILAELPGAAAKTPVHGSKALSHLKLQAEVVRWVRSKCILAGLNTLTQEPTPNLIVIGGGFGTKPLHISKDGYGRLNIEFKGFNMDVKLSAMAEECMSHINKALFSYLKGELVADIEKVGNPTYLEKSVVLNLSFDCVHGPVPRSIRLYNNLPIKGEASALAKILWDHGFLNKDAWSLVIAIKGVSASLRDYNKVIRNFDLIKKLHSEQPALTPLLFDSIRVDFGNTEHRVLEIANLIGFIGAKLNYRNYNLVSESLDNLRELRRQVGCAAFNEAIIEAGLFVGDSELDYEKYVYHSQDQQKHLTTSSDSQADCDYLLFELEALKYLKIRLRHAGLTEAGWSFLCRQRISNIRKLCGGMIICLIPIANYLGMKKLGAIPRLLEFRDAVRFGRGVASIDGSDKVVALKTLFLEALITKQCPIDYSRYQLAEDWLLRTDLKKNLLKWSWARVTREEQRWHRDLVQHNAKNRPKSNICWGSRFGFGDFRVEEFLVRELTSSDELYDEGVSMSHCVGGYVNRCKEGKSFIFSIMDLNGAKVATLELTPAGSATKIGQCFGFRNTKVPRTVAQIAKLIKSKTSAYLKKEKTNR